MKKVERFGLLGLATLLSLFSCQKNEDLSSNVNQNSSPTRAVVDTSSVDKYHIAFVKEDITQKNFGGLGVEWGAYEDTDKIAEGGWDRIIHYMDHLAAARIRLMINYDWFCQNFDNKGNRDPSDDTWTYNFTNKYAKNMIDILEYCQIHHIDVAFGAWNVIGSLEGDIWNMMDQVTSDIRWAKITSDVLNFLVNEKGFSCIKWFVSSNEPNFTGSKGSSKNYNNTYQKWEQGVKNVRNALDAIGLNRIGIIGGDTTGFEGTEEYFTGIASNISNIVADYGYHLYLNNIAVDRGVMLEEINKLHTKIKYIDPKFGNSKKVDIWEAGLLDGKTILDCQKLINTVDYGVRMMDYTLQCLAGGMNGVVYWDFDDGMHFMYSLNSTTPKEWGMFSSLAEASSGKQELRPWYHSISLLTHLFKKGNVIYSPLQNDTSIDNTFRSIATISKDGTQGGFACVNAGVRTTTRTFYMNDEVKGDKLYIYYFGEGTYRLGEDGFIEPNDVIEGSLNKKITLTIPSRSGVVVSNTRL